MGRDIHWRYALKMKKMFFLIALCVLCYSHFVRAQDFTNAVFYEEEIPYKPLEIPGAERSEVDYYRNQYLRAPKSKWLYGILLDAEGYRYYIKKRLLQEKMPLCLEYLPVIESNYKPTAKPASGTSVGMWQFMENSVHPYMTLNEWVDERRDPWKSTDAALAKLKDNYKTFGDWLLALAAYNCGAGAVKRALAKAKDKTYWGLCSEKLIPYHAIKYVPHFLAVCDVIENQEYYGVEFPRVTPEEGGYSPYIDFDYVTVNKKISLERLAVELKLDYETLYNLNLALVKGCTPPHKKYTIRLPIGMKEACEHAIFVITKEKNADN